VKRYYLGELSAPVQTLPEPGHRLIWLAYEQLRGRLYLEMQNWALEKCMQAESAVKNSCVSE